MSDQEQYDSGEPAPDGGGETWTESGEPSAGETWQESGEPSAGETWTESGEPSAGGGWPEAGDPSAGQTWTESGEPSAGGGWPEAGDPSAGATWSESGEPSAGESWQWDAGEGGQYEGGESLGGGASGGYDQEATWPSDGGIPGGTPEQVMCGHGPCPICFMQRQTSSQCVLWSGHDGDHQCQFGDWFGVGGEDLPRDPIVPLCREGCPTCQANPDPNAFKGECVRTIGHDGAHSYSCLHS